MKTKMETNVGFGDVHLQHSLSHRSTPDPAQSVGRPLSMANLRGFEKFWIFNLWLDLLYNLIRIFIYLWLDLLYNFTEIAFIYDLIYLICPKFPFIYDLVYLIICPKFPFIYDLIYLIICPKFSFIYDLIYLIILSTFSFIYDLIYLIICPKSMHLHLDLFDNLPEIGYIYPKRHSESARVPPFRGACDSIRPCLSSRRPQAIFWVFNF